MKQFVPMSIEKSPVSGRNSVSFVGIITPFVGSNRPLKIPFVGRKSPFALYSGFTLIELMVTLVAIAVLLAFVAPGMRGVLQDGRMITQVNNLIADVRLARSEAIRRSRNVSICTWNSTANPTAPACDGGGNWAGGRVIWADQNNDGVLNVGEIVRSREGLAPLTLNQPLGNVDPIVFDNRGASANAINFSLCDVGGLVASGKNIQLAVTGQITLFPGPPASC